jgi:dipeptidyl aminopeptidase/acylaminoacyl peptidase
MARSRPLTLGDSAFAVTFFGGTIAEIPDVYRDASALSHIDEETAPFLVVHGVQDTIVSVEHSRRLVAALRQEGIEVDYVELPDAGPRRFRLDRVGSLALSFLDRHLETRALKQLCATRTNACSPAAS